jgi:hypothetical protein
VVPRQPVQARGQASVGRGRRHREIVRKAALRPGSPSGSRAPARSGGRRAPER